MKTNDSGNERGRVRGWVNPDFPYEELHDLARRVGTVAQNVRERAGLTQGQVEELGGLSQKTLSNWEHAQAGPSKPVLALLDLSNLLPLERFYQRFVKDLSMGSMLMEAGIIPSKPEGAAAVASLPGLNEEGRQHMLDLYHLCLQRFPADEPDDPI